MKIVNFYSFKGGVGRSLSVVNTAYQLSRRGQNVGLIDLDIEAGGLNHILNVTASADRDLLKLLAPENPDVTNLEGYVKEIRFKANEVPRVFLLPTVTDSKLLDQISWNEATQRFIADDLIPEFARQYNLDYILIDSRSGISKFAALALRLASLEILICRLDSQNRYGIGRIVEVCNAAAKPFRIVVSACPDLKPTKKLQAFERGIKAKVDYILPYFRELYYDEFIVSHRNPTHPLAKGYFKLAEDIHNQLS